MAVPNGRGGWDLADSDIAEIAEASFGLTPTLILTVGLPGSGKTTKARAWVAADPKRRARVNRDDLRTMIHGGRLGTPDAEDTVTVAQHAAVAALLDAGINVIADDTNLHPATMTGWHAVAAKTGATIEVWDLTTVPLDVCHARNEQRTGPARVPPEVIDGMRAKLGLPAEIDSYTVSALPYDHPDRYLFELKVERRDVDAWAVLKRGHFCLGADGTWEHERQTSNRETGWLTSHRFGHDEALRRARAAAETMTWAGRSAASILAADADG